MTMSYCCDDILTIWSYILWKSNLLFVNVVNCVRLVCCSDIGRGYCTTEVQPVCYSVLLCATSCNLCVTCVPFLCNLSVQPVCATCVCNLFVQPVCTTFVYNFCVQPVCVTCVQFLCNLCVQPVCATVPHSMSTSHPANLLKTNV